MSATSRTKSGGTDSFKPPGEIKAGDERPEPTDEGFTCIHCDRAYEGFGELAWLSPAGPCCRNVHPCRNRCSAEIGYLKDILKSEKSRADRAVAVVLRCAHFFKVFIGCVPSQIREDVGAITRTMGVSVGERSPEAPDEG